MAMPRHVKYLVMGAGIHGLSTAWHLAEKLEARGKGGGRNISARAKTTIVAVACGVVRPWYQILGPNPSRDPGCCGPKQTRQVLRAS